jgi:hypothetical protein
MLFEPALFRLLQKSRTPAPVSEGIPAGFQRGVAYKDAAVGVPREQLQALNAHWLPYN